jgi:hypothetical protein
MGDCVVTLEAAASAAASPDTQDGASDTEDLQGHVNMNSLDDDCERWGRIRSDVWLLDLGVLCARGCSHA